MTDGPDNKPDAPVRRGGLGRGLGALIPSAPMGGASGKGHFWTALDNPPPVDEQPNHDVIGGVRERQEDRPQTTTDTPQTPAQRDVPGSHEETVDVQFRNGSAADHPVDSPVDTVPDTASAPDQPDRVPAVEHAVEPEVSSAEPADVSRETDSGETAAVLVEIDPDAIRANPKNPRQVFDDDELAELSESIKEFGLLQPIVVRSTPDGYELIMGERRLRAARLAGIDRIPVIVRQTEDDAMLRDALLENIHRVQLHPLEEAAAYQQLIDEFGVTHEELATRIKRSRPVISNTIRLLKLPTRVQNRVAAGVISGSHARALLSLEDPEAQEALATKIVAEGMSVRATEEAVAMRGSENAPTRRAARRKTVTAPALSSLAERLSDHFDTRALVQLGRSKGKIIVEFASIDDLERIVAMMAPPLATSRDAQPDAEADSAGPPDDPSNRG